MKIKEEYKDKYISGNGLNKTKVSDIDKKDFKYIKKLGFGHIFESNTKKKVKKSDDKTVTESN